jgi:hypothetical protein
MSAGRQRGARNAPSPLTSSLPSSIVHSSEAGGDPRAETDFRGALPGEYYRRLAQLVEHHLHTVGVNGSSPLAPTTHQTVHAAHVKLKRSGVSRFSLLCEVFEWSRGSQSGSPASVSTDEAAAARAATAEIRFGTVSLVKRVGDRSVLVFEVGNKAPNATKSAGSCSPGASSRVPIRLSILSGYESRPPAVRRHCRAVPDGFRAARQLSRSPRPAPE